MKLFIALRLAYLYLGSVTNLPETWDIFFFFLNIERKAVILNRL